MPHSIQIFTTIPEIQLAQTLHRKKSTQNCGGTI